MAYLFWIHVQVTEAHWTIRIERIGFSGETMQFDEHESQCNSVKACIRARCLLVHKPPLNSSIVSRALSNFRNALLNVHPPHRLRFIPAIDRENVGLIVDFYAQSLLRDQISRERVKKKEDEREHRADSLNLYPAKCIRANFARRGKNDVKILHTFNEKLRGRHKRYQTILSALQLLLQMNAELMALRSKFFNDSYMWETLYTQFFQNQFRRISGFTFYFYAASFTSM